MFSSEIFLRKFILKIYLRKFIFENLSSKIHLRKFIFEIFSSDIYLRKFIFENLSSKIYLRKFIFAGKMENQVEKMKVWKWKRLHLAKSDMSVSLRSALVYVFGCACPQTPFNVILYKKPDVKLYPFFDELSWWSSSPRPQSMSKLQKFLDSKGRTRLANLCRARSRLYRRRFLQVNTRWKALAEIYKMRTLLHRSDLNISANLWVRSDDIDWGQGERM